MGSGNSKNKVDAPVDKKKVEKPKEQSAQQNSKPIDKQNEEALGGIHSHKIFGAMSDMEIINELKTYESDTLDLSTIYEIKHDVAVALIELIKTGKLKTVNLSHCIIDTDDLKTLCESVEGTTIICEHALTSFQCNMVMWYCTNLNKSIQC